jgi:hypothetical protein
MPVSPERIEALRHDPDFRELVKCLKNQSQDAIDLFLEQQDDATPEGAEHGREDTPSL